VHGDEALQMAIDASQILFGKNVTDILRKLDERTLLSVFEGVPTFNINRKELDAGIGIIDLVAEKTEVLPSKGEARRTIKGGGLGLNKEKVTTEELIVKTTDLLNDKYLLIQKGKKNYFLIIAE
jgi:tyrosyl-tRNA synthetase